MGWVVGRGHAPPYIQWVLRTYNTNLNEGSSCDFIIELIAESVLRSAERVVRWLVETHHMPCWIVARALYKVAAEFERRDYSDRAKQVRAADPLICWLKERYGL